MKLHEVGEVGLIKLLQQDTIVNPAGVRVGIGDDTAVLENRAETLTLATTDMLVEGEHFLATTLPAHALGYKALAVNLSDIAAMGGVACHALVAIAIPPEWSVEGIVEIYRGMKELACKHGVNIIGGDTVSSPHGLTISVTVLGEVTERQLLLRSTAQVGDKILVTGTLGGARGGLSLALGEVLAGDLAAEEVQGALRKHQYPQPRLLEIQTLLAAGSIRAANDVSDGLAKDLREICAASQVGAVVWAAALPIDPGAQAIAQTTGQDPLDFALFGGEDFELLLTVAPTEVEAVVAAADVAGLSLTVIGEILPPEAGVLLQGVAGTRVPLAVGGWDHFRKGAQ